MFLGLVAVSFPLSLASLCYDDRNSDLDLDLDLRNVIISMRCDLDVAIDALTYEYIILMLIHDTSYIIYINIVLDTPSRLSIKYYLY